MDRRSNRLVIATVSLTLACLGACGGAMTDTDESSTPRGGAGGAAGLGVGSSQGGAVPSLGGSSTGGNTKLVPPPAGGATTDYRCMYRFDSGDPCGDDSDESPTSAVGFDPETSTCVQVNFYACGASSLGETFPTLGGCEAVCRGVPSSQSCSASVPVAGSACTEDSAICTYFLSPSDTEVCLCDDFSCYNPSCSIIMPLEHAEGGTCKDGLCVAESPVVLLSATKKVCRCTRGIWECEDFRLYSNGE